MALIYIKMMSGIPVILMGETGIGKTALMELLSAII
jgi:MoxR-like ATPase